MERFKKFFDTYGPGTRYGAIDAASLELHREDLGADIRVSGPWGRLELYGRLSVDPRPGSARRVAH